MPNPVIAVEIGCRDADKIADFYAAAFGWSFGAYGAHARQFETGADSGVNGHVTALGHEPHDYVLFYVEVEDITAAIEKIVAAGGASHIGPYPMNDGRQFAWAKDPDGKLIGLLTPKP